MVVMSYSTLSASSEEAGQIRSLYDTFPFVVRSSLDEWISSCLWNKIDPDNPQHDEYCRYVFNHLLETLDIRHQNEELDLYVRIQLMEARCHLSNIYAECPAQMVREIKKRLEQERQIIDQHNAVSVTYPLVAFHKR